MHLPRFMEKGMPVIIEGLDEDWAAKGKW